jgi:hypothetical protein
VVVLGVNVLGDHLRDQWDRGRSAPPRIRSLAGCEVSTVEHGPNCPRRALTHSGRSRPRSSSVAPMRRGVPILLLGHRRTALALLFLGRACMLPARMKLRPRLFVVLSVLLWAASFPGSVSAHGTVGAGGMGWSDELALVLTPLILVLALGWFVLDGRRASKPHPHRRRRARR